MKVKKSKIKGIYLLLIITVWVIIIYMFGSNLFNLGNRLLDNINKYLSNVFFDLGFWIGLKLNTVIVSYKNFNFVEWLLTVVLNILYAPLGGFTLNIWLFNSLSILLGLRDG